MPGLAQDAGAGSRTIAGLMRRVTTPDKFPHLREVTSRRCAENTCADRWVVHRTVLTRAVAGVGLLSNWDPPRRCGDPRTPLAPYMAQATQRRRGASSVPRGAPAHSRQSSRDLWGWSPASVSHMTKRTVSTYLFRVEDGRGGRGTRPGGPALAGAKCRRAWPGSSW